MDSKKNSRIRNISVDYKLVTFTPSNLNHKFNCNLFNNVGSKLMFLFFNIIWNGECMWIPNSNSIFLFYSYNLIGNGSIWAKQSRSLWLKRLSLSRIIYVDYMKKKTLFPRYLNCNESNWRLRTVECTFFRIWFNSFIHLGSNGYTVVEYMWILSNFLSLSSSNSIHKNRCAECIPNSNKILF